MKFRKIIQNTPKQIAEASRKVSVRQHSFLQGRNNKLRFQTLTLNPSGATKRYNKHRFVVYANRNYNGSLLDTDVKISCDCSYFMYYLEVALARAGAADIIFSDGSMPVITNPSLKVYGCKHALAVYKYMKKNNL